MASRMKSKDEAWRAVASASLDTMILCVLSRRPFGHLVLRRGEQHDLGAERARELHAHAAETAEADDADLLAGLTFQCW